MPEPSAPRPLTAFGEQVRALLDDRGRGEQWLAERTDVSRTHLYRVLRGEKALTDALLAKVAVELAVDPEHFAEFRLRQVTQWLREDPVALDRTYRTLSRRHRPSDADPA